MEGILWGRVKGQCYDKRHVFLSDRLIMRVLSTKYVHETAAQGRSFAACCHACCASEVVRGWRWPYVRSTHLFLIENAYGLVNNAGYVASRIAGTKTV
jgi:hypothetical protein